MNLPGPELESGSEVSEEEISRLVRLAQDNDKEAFGDLFDLLQRKLHRQAFFLTGHEQQALDLLQETLIESWNHLGRYNGRVRFFTWVCSIMLHRHYDWLRRLRVRAAAACRHKDEASDESAAPSPLDSAHQLDRARLLRECLDQLPAKQRTVVYLRFYSGESLEGIAALLKCSVGTVKSRLFHGLEKLARMHKLKEFQEHPPSETQT